MPLLTFTSNPYPFVKSDLFTRVVTSDVVPGHRVIVYSNKRCVYYRDVLKCRELHVDAMYVE